MQRVVVLTDEEIKVTRRALVLVRERDEQEKELLNSSYDKLGDVLEHPEGITNGMVERGCAALIEAQGYTREAVSLKDARDEVLAVLEAVLFQADDNE